MPIITECPSCDATVFFGWDEETYGFTIHQCEECKEPMWLEMTRIGGKTYDHELFIKDVATPEGRTEEANRTMERWRKFHND